MNLKPFKVTKKKNVKSFDVESGVFELIDDSAVGLAIAEHLVPFSRVVQKEDIVSKQMVDTVESGFSELLSVLWSHLRSPALRHEATSDLVWLEIEKDESSLTDDEPYSSLEHIIELSEEGDPEAIDLIKVIKAFSDTKIADEPDDEDEVEVDEDEDELPEMSM